MTRLRIGVLTGFLLCFWIPMGLVAGFAERVLAPAASQAGIVRSAAIMLVLGLGVAYMRLAQKHPALGHVSAMAGATLFVASMAIWQRPAFDTWVRYLPFVIGLALVAFIILAIASRYDRHTD